MPDRPTNDEIEKLIATNPQASAQYASIEMHYGRLEWLAEHIRLCNFQISPDVARKILSMLEGGDPKCLFELRAMRRSDLPSRASDQQSLLFRAANMAVEIAEKCNFERGQLKKALYEVGAKHGLKAEYVRKQVAPFRQYALDCVAEQKIDDAYTRGEVDFLGGSKSP